MRVDIRRTTLEGAILLLVERYAKHLDTGPDSAGKQNWASTLRGKVHRI